MKNRKVLFLAIFVYIIFLHLNHPVLSASTNEDERILTPAEEITDDSLKTSSTRSYDEGITIKKVEVEGNNLVDESVILDKMQIQVGSLFDREALQKDLKSIYGLGYFTDNIKVLPEATPTGVTLKIIVEENVPVTGFNVTGNAVLTEDELALLFADQTGLPQNISQLNATIEKVEKLYADKGYVLARVKKVTDDPDGMVNIEINEGVIEEVNITGNLKTKDFIIMRNLGIQEGSVYNEKALKQDIKRLISTKAFSDVRRVLTVSDKDPNKYSLTVEVDEKRTGALSMGGGVDTGSGLFGSLGYTDTNFMGKGQSVSTALIAGTGVIYDDRDTVKRANLQFEASFSEPRFRNTLNSIQLSAFGREYGSFQVPLAIERRLGTEFEWARPLNRFKNTGVSLGLGVENIDVREGNRGLAEAFMISAMRDPAKRAEQLEDGFYLNLSPSIVYDSRDHYMTPRSGWYNTFSLRNALAVSGDAGSYGKATANLRKYFPIAKESTLAVNLQLGNSVLGDLPEFASYRLGGNYSVRGFAEGNVGSGSGFLLSSAELRTPIPFLEKLGKIDFIKNMKAAFFVDAGQLFNETISNDVYGRPGYGISAGAGLRINVPGLGPLRFDYGIPLTNVGSLNSSGGRLNFGFGEKF